jgi:hypothetical protein
MRRIVFLCIVQAVTLPLGAETRIVETAGSGLVIESMPTAAKVFIDGIERGLSPLSLEGLSPGVHTLRITKDWYNDWTARITVPALGRLEVFVDLSPATGTIAVSITEEGNDFSDDAYIFLNGIETSGREFRAHEGWRTVKVSAFGWQDAQKSVFVVRNERIILDFDLKRAVFKLDGPHISRSVLNPAGSGAQGTLVVDFTVSAPGTGRFVVLDEEDNEVFSAPLGEFERTAQRYVWDSRDKNGEMLKDGVYRIHIAAEGYDGAALSSVPLTIRVDSTLDETPLSLGSGLAGLFYVPVPDAQTRGDFQIETSIVLGKPPGENRGFDTLPFSVSLSLSPVDRWQLAAAVNMRPNKDGAVGLAAAGSVKREFLKSEGFVPEAAVIIAYGWVKSSFISAFGIKSGVQLNVPFSWRLGRRISLHIAPAVLWTGRDGYPREPIPRVAASGGLLCRFRLFSAALSFQTINTLAADVEEFCPAAISAELRFMPPRSNLNLGLLAGGFFNGDNRGGYGGFSIGVLF